MKALLLLLIAQSALAATSIPGNRVASVYISQDFVNEQLAQHVKSPLLKKLSIDLDPEHDQILLKGELDVPIEELRAVNLDPKLGKFRFQMAIKLESTRQGHLLVVFPLGETYFYPIDSKEPERDRVVVPVQMLSVALASARGYLAALSGDFEGFDRRATKLQALVKSLDRAIAHEKNADALEGLKTQRDATRVQLEAIPIERKQLMGLSKEVAGVLGFTGEKELSLNNELAARRNALVLKIKLSQLVPYLDGVELGGIRIVHDKKDGNGENYFVVDVASQLEGEVPQPTVTTPSDRPGMKTAPALIVRLNQSLFEAKAIVETEKKDLGSTLKDFELELKDDGLHVSGSVHTFLFFSVAFDTIVDFVSTGADTFEMRVRELKVAGINFGFLEKTVLESLKKRLNHSLKGMCKFKYLGEENDKSHALRATIDPKALVPGFSDLHLVGVDVRDREFLLKVGKL